MIAEINKYLTYLRQKLHAVQNLNSPPKALQQGFSHRILMYLASITKDSQFLPEANSAKCLAKPWMSVMTGIQ